MRRMILGLFSAIVLLVLFVILFTFVRRPYEIVLLNRFGTLIPESKQVRIAYNWYLKLPTDGVVRIDHRLHLYPGLLKQVVTSMNAPICVQTYAAWRITDPVKFYNKTSGGSDQMAEKFIDDRIQALVGQKFGKHTLDELFNTDEKKVQSDELEKEIATEATNGSADGTPGLKDVGLEVAQVGFSRLAFPPNNTVPVYGRMVADLNTQAKAIESDGKAQADIIRSKGDQDAAQIRGTASAQAQAIRGGADQEANSILAGVQKTPAAREFYQYWKSLDFVKASLSKNSVFVLTAENSPWLKALFQDPNAPDAAPAKGVTAPELPTVSPVPAGK